MPVWTVELGGVELKAHATAYAYLARSALRCFAEHPVWGVGANNFPISCPVWTMDTYGRWNEHMASHNQYLGMIAEQGALGTLAWLAFAFLVARALRSQHDTRWLLTVYLLAGFASAVLHVVPFAAWLAGTLIRPSARVDAAEHA